MLQFTENPQFESIYQKVDTNNQYFRHQREDSLQFTNILRSSAEILELLATIYFQFQSFMHKRNA